MSSNDRDQKDKYRIDMQKLCSILDSLMSFPAYARPRIRSRITKFAFTDFMKYIQSVDTNVVDDTQLALGTSAAHAATDGSNSNITDGDSGDEDINYHVAAKGLRSTIEESHSSELSPFVRYLVHSKLKDFA